MSEEEIISSINALILYARCQKDSGEKYKKVAVDNIDIQALNGILDLYNKEKNEVLHWKGQYYLLSRKIDTISKDKIRELKKSLQEQIAETRELFFDSNTISEIIYENEIKLLQELLEE